MYRGHDLLIILNETATSLYFFCSFIMEATTTGSLVVSFKRLIASGSKNQPRCLYRMQPQACPRYFIHSSQTTGGQ